MQIKSAVYVKSATRPEHYPPGTIPEVAFAGRSNVGKSSLINCLLQRRKLVRTSKTPGQTQTINFFLINGAFHLVDLPGYGFARVPEKIRAQWGHMMEMYLSGRPSLRGIVHILDVRHPPTADDLTLWHWIQSRHIPVIPVLTKADKINRSQWESHLKRAAASLSVSLEQLVLFSAENQYGRDALWERLGQWISAPLPQEPPSPL